VYAVAEAVGLAAMEATVPGPAGLQLYSGVWSTVPTLSAEIGDRRLLNVVFTEVIDGIYSTCRSSPNVMPSQPLLVP